MSIEVPHFREILFWPFMFQHYSDTAFDKLVSAGGWCEVNDCFGRSYRKDSERPREVRYGEFLYFQPYVQRFLYGDKDSEQAPPTSAWRRDDVVGVKVKLSREEDSVVEFTVEQLWLLRFKLGKEHGVAILALEVKATRALSLRVVETCLDQFRRVYPPYWENRRAGRIPTQVTWRLADDSEKSFALESEEHYHDEIAETLRPPLAAHWGWLLDRGQAGEVLKELRQIEDERMPTMAYLAVDDPRALQRRDFVRLCFADDAGDSGTLPYATHFLADFDNRYCYDRYWSPSLDEGQKGKTMRFLNCGYAFTIIGDNRDSDFFTQPDFGALSHFRNHYFMMGLVTHFQKAALLSFSDRLSCAVMRDEKVLRNEARKTLRQIIDFTDRYWFVDLSNQIQAQELYALWRKHLKLDALYQQVMDEAQTLMEYLENEARQREEAMVTRLTWVGAFWGLFSLLASYGITDILKDTPYWPELSTGIMALVSLVFIGLVIRRH